MTQQTQKLQIETPKNDQKPKEPEKKAPAKLTKKAMVEQLLKSENGTTIDEVAEKTGWQNHTIRGHFSTIKKNGRNVISEEKDEKRRYKIKADVANKTT